MVFIPVVALNGLSQLAAAAVSVIVAVRLKEGRKSALQRPLLFLSAAFAAIALINILWSLKVISISAWDDMFVGPVFNLVFMGVWFYAGISISGHRNVYYLIPLFVMSGNTLLIFNDLAVVCDLIVGLMLVGVFFHLGFVDRHLVRRISYAGMAYGLLIPAVSAFSYFSGAAYVGSPWFLPNILAAYMVFLIGRGQNVSVSAGHPVHHRSSVVLEVFRLGFYVLCLSVFIMLGTLGVHEMGHSLAARSFGCSHQTQFGIGHAVTHVECESAAGSTFIVLGGFALTVLISVMMYIVGNGFARRIALMIFGFSMIMAVDDFTVLGLQHSAIVALVFIASIVLGVGLVKLVKDYEVEYDIQGSAALTAAGSRHL